MSIAIIGSGISGSVLQKELPGSVVFEKSKTTSGRLYTVQLATNEKFDVGATFFRDPISYLDGGRQVANFSLRNYLSFHCMDSGFLSAGEDIDLFFPKTGMKCVSTALLDTKNIFLQHELEKISRNPEMESWTLSFTNGKEASFDTVILAQHLPGIISSLKNSGIMTEWDNFTRDYSEYTSILIITGLWRNLSNDLLSKIHSLSTIQGERGTEMELITLESKKYPPETNTLILSIQFSASFSSRNLERWVDENYKPLPASFAAAEYFLPRALALLGLQELEDKVPDEFYPRKWRYAFPDSSLFERELELDFSSEKYRAYLDMCYKTNIWPIGDWLWGGDVSRCVLGGIELAKEIKKKGLP
ncbi:MAG: FAD-dependent oxidoreductase [Leptospiraceae bacterium]|nr:FAD-dependent oxidoreductase [Leptospiraceae bacterium]MCP5500830.1 FAD-dependent oxidoreductase [Leptospiraceae bacterium]